MSLRVEDRSSGDRYPNGFRRELRDAARGAAKYAMKMGLIERFDTDGAVWSSDFFADTETMEIRWGAGLGGGLSVYVGASKYRTNEAFPFVKAIQSTPYHGEIEVWVAPSLDHWNLGLRKPDESMNIQLSIFGHGEFSVVGWDGKKHTDAYTRERGWDRVWRERLMGWGLDPVVIEKVDYRKMKAAFDDLFAGHGKAAGFAGLVGWFNRALR